MVLESIGPIILIILTGVVVAIIAKLVGRIADRFNLTNIHLIIIEVAGFILMGLGIDNELWMCILGVILIVFGGAGIFYRMFKPVPIDTSGPEIKPENIDKIDIDNLDKIEPIESESPEQVEKN